MSDDLHELRPLADALRESVAELHRAGGSIRYIEGLVQSGLHDVGEDYLCEIKPMPEELRRALDEEERAERAEGDGDA